MPSTSINSLSSAFNLPIIPTYVSSIFHPAPWDKAISRYGQSREIIAKIGPALRDQEFLRYLLWVDNSHIPRSGLSPFRFTSARRGRSLDVVALGQQAIEQLLAKGHLIATAVSQEFGTSPFDRREFGMCSIDLWCTPIATIFLE